MPSLEILSYAAWASSFIEKDTYPTPLEEPDAGSVTTKAVLTGPKSEKRVLRSVDVAV